MPPAFTTSVLSRAPRLNRWRRPLVRLGKVVILALAAVWVTYVAGANLFLSTGWFGRVVNEYPEGLDVHYAKGWTVWPGRLHARDLSIRATDSNVEWILRIDAVTFDVSLWGLLHRRFEADHVHGTGVSLRMRQRLDSFPRSEAEVADLPPIEGLPAYAVRPKVEDPYPVWDDAYWDYWTIRLSDVVAEHTREVWFGGTRFAGDARVSGGFYLKPIREAQVGPVHADVDHGTLTRGEKKPLASRLGGAIDVTVDTFDPRVTPGKAVVPYVHVRSDLSAILVSPVDATVTARVGLSRGSIEEGSRLEAFVPGFRQSAGDMDVRGAVIFGAEAEHDALEAHAQSWGVRLEKDGKAVAEGDVRAQARIRGLQIDRDVLDVSGSRVVLSRATVAEQKHEETRWGGEIAVDDARLHLHPMHFEGRARLGASDAFPVFATLLRDKAPRLVESLLDMPRLQGLAWVSAGSGTFAVRDVVVRGGDVWIRGAYGKVGEHTLGAFVIGKEALAVGLGIDDDGAHPRLFGLDAWLGEQQEALNRLMEERARQPAARGRGAPGPRSGP